VLQPLGTKQVKPEPFAETGIDVSKLALTFTKSLEMKSAALVFCAMTIAIQSEILQKVLVKPCLCQETVVVTDQLQIPFTSNRFCNLLHGLVMLELMAILWVGVNLQVQAFVPHAIALDVMNGRIEFQVDGLHFTLCNVPVL
jgi:hypothetical protein